MKGLAEEKVASDSISCSRGSHVSDEAPLIAIAIMAMGLFKLRLKRVQMAQGKEDSQTFALFP